MVKASDIVCIYRVDDVARLGGMAQRGLGDGSGVMDSGRVRMLSGCMVASTKSQARAIQIFALKMDQRLTAEMTFEASACGA
jgi:hypothetical protein